MHSLTIRVLPPYEPVAEEKQDPQLYAKNVREVMLAAHGELRKQVRRSVYACLKGWATAFDH